MTVVDLFAGPGGWGAHPGIDFSDDVCATRRAAGLPTRQADVSMVQPTAYGDVRGVIASPPCPPFSTVGNGKGRQDLELLAAGLELLAEGQDCRRDVKDQAADPRSRGTARTLDQPAPTIMFGKSPSGVAWYDAQGGRIRDLSVEEALRIQGFPPDYPLQGGKVSRYRQIGDAVPRGLARAALLAVDPAGDPGASLDDISGLESRP